MSTTTDAMIAEAMELLRGGRLAEADSIYTRILAEDPGEPDALHFSGLIAAQSNEWDRAAHLIQRSLAHEPGNAEAHCNLGTVYKTLGRLDDALACYDAALQAAPDTAAIHFNRALILHAMPSLAAALQGYETAARLDPEFAEAFNAAGRVLHQMGRPQQAVPYFRRAIALDAGFAEAHSNLGCMLRELGDLPGALQEFSLAILHQDDFIEAYSNRGAAYTELGRYAEALADYDRTLELAPELAAAHCNRSYVHLVTGNFESGWADYEWRLRVPGSNLVRDSRTFDRPRWRGAGALSGKTILLHSEQGFGDTIQFCRYASTLAARGANVVLEVPEALVALLESVPGASLVIARGSPLPNFDWHCPLMSLPAALRTTLASIPADIPYLKPDAQRVRRWSELLGAKRKLRVGLVWSGGFRPDQPELWAVNRRRNIDLAKLASLRHPQVDFYSLQKGEPAESELKELQLAAWNGPAIIDHTGRLHNFADTAALIFQLDLVIAVDTATAHLAGAMGKPVWMMNRHDTCWRWLLHRDDSPWYPTLRLYRQGDDGNWDDVIERVRTDLNRLVLHFENA